MEAPLHRSHVISALGVAFATFVLHPSGGLSSHASAAEPPSAPSKAPTIEKAADAPQTPVQLVWDKPIRCITNDKNEVLRVQCEKKGDQQICYFAPNEQANGGGPLERTKLCDADEPRSSYDDLVRSGARWIPAVAEAPPGYLRAPNGRAYQVKFDLLNRIYLGASWVPTFNMNTQGPVDAPAELPFGRGQAELGMHISVLSHSGRSRHDIRILEGTATFADFELRGQLFAYDYQHLHRRPAFWLTSFFGHPRLYAVAPPVGFGFRVVRLNDRPPAFKNTFDLEFAEFHVAWNPLQSDDLYNHLRVEAGVDVGKYWTDRNEIGKGLGSGATYLGLTSAIKGRLTVGDAGLHNLFMNLAYERPYFLDGPTAGGAANRFTASLGYEGIFVAVNDQPFSFRLAAEGATKDAADIDIRSLELRIMAGLRFSFWAPPRVFEPLPEFEDP